MVSPEVPEAVAVITASLNSSLSPIKSLSLVNVTDGIPSLSSMDRSTLVPDEAACPLLTEEIVSLAVSVPS